MEVLAVTYSRLLQRIDCVYKEFNLASVPYQLCFMKTAFAVPLALFRSLILLKSVENNELSGTSPCLDELSMNI